MFRLKSSLARYKISKPNGRKCNETKVSTVQNIPAFGDTKYHRSSHYVGCQHSDRG